MKLKKLLLGLVLMVSLLPLASCLGTEKENTDVTGGSSTGGSGSSSSTSTKMQYEAGNVSVDFWESGLGIRYMRVAVPVKNTGDINIYLDSISIDIENVSGNLLQTLSLVGAYPEFIKPGETGYYYEEHSCDFTDTNVKAIAHVSVEKAKRDVIRYDVSDISIKSDTYDGIKITGRVANDTSKTETLAEISINLYDSNDRLICVCYTYLNSDLNSGSKVGFTVTPYMYRYMTVSDIARYEAYAYPGLAFNW